MPLFKKVVFMRCPAHGTAHPIGASVCPEPECSKLLVPQYATNRVAVAIASAACGLLAVVMWYVAVQKAKAEAARHVTEFSAVARIVCTVDSSICTPRHGPGDMDTWRRQEQQEQQEQKKPPLPFKTTDAWVESASGSDRVQVKARNGGTFTDAVTFKGGDIFCIKLSTDAPHAYIFGKTKEGWMRLVADEGGGPVRPVRAPRNSGQNYRIDQGAGTEEFLVAFSATPVSNLEGEKIDSDVFQTALTLLRQQRDTVYYQVQLKHQ